MPGRPQAGKARARGNIELLPSGALRVRVYAGVDPVTRKRHNLIEVVPAGPGAMRKAEMIRNRFVVEVAERRNPRTSATVDQLLDRYLDQFDGAPNTVTLYRGYVRNHISPFLGHLKVGQLDAEALDSVRCPEHTGVVRTLSELKGFSARATPSDERPGRCRGIPRGMPIGVAPVRTVPGGCGRCGECW